MKRSFWKVTLFGTCALAIAAAVLFPPAQRVAAAGPSGEQVVKFRVRDDIISLDPAYVQKPSDHLHAFNIYDGLVRLKAGTTELEPNLATSWDLSPDGKVYTFHLRRGVKWHKGYGDFTAKDVKYSLDRIKDPNTKSRYLGNLTPLKKIEIVDDYTIKLHLDKPFPSFLRAVLAYRPGWIVNERAIKEKGKRYGQDPIGTGPFMFDKWVRGSEIVGVRNPDYYEKVHIEKYIAKVIRKDTVAKLALERGDLDWSLFLEGAAIEAMKKNKKLKVQSAAGYSTHFLWFNLKRKPFNDIRMRRAILHAINKVPIAKYVFFDNATTVHNLLNPNVFGYERLEKNFYDPEKAKKLLAEAGYPNGLKINALIFPTGDWPKIGAVLQQQWRKVGIDTKIVAPERAIFNRLWLKSQYDIISIIITRVDADQYLHPWFFTGVRRNTAGYTGADKEILQARHTVDDAKREAFIKSTARKIFLEDLVGFGMVNVKYALAMHPYVKNNVFTFQDSYPLRQIWLEK